MRPNRRPTRRLSVPLLLLFLLPGCWRAAGAAEAPFSFEAVMARLAAVPERQASFREFKHFGALDTPLESRGWLRLRRGTLEKVTTWPVEERLEIRADRLVVTVGNEPPRVLDAGMAPELRVLIDAVRGPLVGDAAALRRGFSVLTEGTMASWHLVLQPRDPAAARLLRRVVLDGKDDQLLRLEVGTANGDDQVMEITPSP